MINLRALWIRFLDAVGPARRLQIVDGDSLPPRLPLRDLVLARDEGEDWCVGMQCPCGCGDTIELLVIAEARPRWDVRVGKNKKPTLHPSVWRKQGCGSHFWIKDGKVKWC
jgi:hypothetical protein